MNSKVKPNTSERCTSKRKRSGVEASQRDLDLPLVRSKQPGYRLKLTSENGIMKKVLVVLILIIVVLLYFS